MGHRGYKIVDRLVEVLKRDRDVTDFALKQRFGVGNETIRRARELAGVPRPEDEGRKIK